MKVYLAGPITGLNYKGATDWRFYAKEFLAQFGITGVSPMRSKNCLDNLKAIDETMDADGWQSALIQPPGVVCRDRYDCTTADVILMNFLGSTAVSKGTLIELGWADALRVPIVACLEPDNLHHHIMFDAMVPFITDNVEDALQIVLSILKP